MNICRIVNKMTVGVLFIMIKNNIGFYNLVLRNFKDWFIDFVLIFVLK